MSCQWFGGGAIWLAPLFFIVVVVVVSMVVVIGVSLGCCVLFL